MRHEDSRAAFFITSIQKLARKVHMISTKKAKYSCTHPEKEQRKGVVNMKKTPLNNERGFTLIEIIAVLVILGILAAVAIPKYIDMRDDAVKKAVSAATSELNARERLTLAKWKLQDKPGKYETAFPADYNTILGPDWNGGAAIVSGTSFTHAGKTVTCTRTPQADENEPGSWACAVT